MAQYGSHKIVKTAAQSSANPHKRQPRREPGGGVDFKGSTIREVITPHWSYRNMGLKTIRWTAAALLSLIAALAHADDQVARIMRMTPAELDQDLHNGAAQAARDLPQRMDSVTTLQSTTYTSANKTWTFVYTADTNFNVEEVRAAWVNMQCSFPGVEAFLRRGVTFRKIFFLPNKRSVEMSARDADCRKAG